jgi:hypothetical protein
MNDMKNIFFIFESIDFKIFMQIPFLLKTQQNCVDEGWIIIGIDTALKY